MTKRNRRFFAKRLYYRAHSLIIPKTNGNGTQSMDTSRIEAEIGRSVTTTGRDGMTGENQLVRGTKRFTDTLQLVHREPFYSGHKPTQQDTSKSAAVSTDDGRWPSASLFTRNRLVTDNPELSDGRESYSGMAVSTKQFSGLGEDAVNRSATASLLFSSVSDSGTWKTEVSLGTGHAVLRASDDGVSLVARKSHDSLYGQTVEQFTLGQLRLLALLLKLDGAALDEDTRVSQNMHLDGRADPPFGPVSPVNPDTMDVMTFYPNNPMYIGFGKNTESVPDTDALSSFLAMKNIRDVLSSSADAPGFGNVVYGVMVFYFLFYIVSQFSTVEDALSDLSGGAFFGYGGRVYKTVRDTALGVYSRTQLKSAFGSSYCLANPDFPAFGMLDKDDYESVLNVALTYCSTGGVINCNHLRNLFNAYATREDALTKLMPCLSERGLNHATALEMCEYFEKRMFTDADDTVRHYLYVDPVMDGETMTLFGLMIADVLRVLSPADNPAQSGTDGLTVQSTGKFHSYKYLRRSLFWSMLGFADMIGLHPNDPELPDEDWSYRFSLARAFRCSFKEMPSKEDSGVTLRKGTGADGASCVLEPMGDASLGTEAHPFTRAYTSEAHVNTAYVGSISSSGEYYDSGNPTDIAVSGGDIVLDVPSVRKDNKTTKTTLGTASLPFDDVFADRLHGCLPYVDCSDGTEQSVTPKMPVGGIALLALELYDFDRTEILMYGETFVSDRYKTVAIAHNFGYQSITQLDKTVQYRFVPLHSVQFSNRRAVCLAMCIQHGTPLNSLTSSKFEARLELRRATMFQIRHAGDLMTFEDTDTPDYLLYYAGDGMLESNVSVPLFGTFRFTEDTLGIPQGSPIRQLMVSVQRQDV